MTSLRFHGFGLNPGCSQSKARMEGSLAAVRFPFTAYRCETRNEAVSGVSAGGLL